MISQWVHHAINSTRDCKDFFFLLCMPNSSLNMENNDDSRRIHTTFSYFKNYLARGALWQGISVFIFFLFKFSTLFSVFIWKLNFWFISVNIDPSCCGFFIKLVITLAQHMPATGRGSYIFFRWWENKSTLVPGEFWNKMRGRTGLLFPAQHKWKFNRFFRWYVLCFIQPKTIKS